MTFRCEVCDTPLCYRGGPHLPRWCADHRAEEAHKAHRERQKKYRDKAGTFHGTAQCDGCDTAMLQPSDDGLCGFCQVEAGVVQERVLLSRNPAGGPGGSDQCASFA